VFVCIAVILGIAVSGYLQVRDAPPQRQ
jgi:hypothetical protein